MPAVPVHVVVFDILLLLLLIIIIISSKTALYEPQPSLDDSSRFDLVFTSLDFATIIILHSMVVRLAPNSLPGGPGPCIYVPL
jgi:hypothetical protein